jgi:hydroxypyruvate isomerase
MSTNPKPLSEATTDIEKRLAEITALAKECWTNYACPLASHIPWLIEQLQAQLQLHDTNLDIAINDRNYWRERAGTAERKNAALKARVAELEKAIQTALDRPAMMGTDDIEVLSAALERADTTLEWYRKQLEKEKA